MDHVHNMDLHSFGCAPHITCDQDDLRFKYSPDSIVKLTNRTRFVQVRARRESVGEEEFEPLVFMHSGRQVLG